MEQKITPFRPLAHQTACCNKRSEMSGFPKIYQMKMMTPKDYFINELRWESNLAQNKNKII
jgi:hypothetical protein